MAVQPGRVSLHQKLRKVRPGIGKALGPIRSIGGRTVALERRDIHKREELVDLSVSCG